MDLLFQPGFNYSLDSGHYADDLAANEMQLQKQKQYCMFPCIIIIFNIFLNHYLIIILIGIDNCD